MSRLTTYLSLYKLSPGGFLFDPETGDCSFGSGTAEPEVPYIVPNGEGYFMERGILELAGPLREIGITSIWSLPGKIRLRKGSYGTSPFWLGKFREFFSDMPWLSDWTEIVRCCGIERGGKVAGLEKSRRTEIMLEDVMNKYPWMWEETMTFEIRPIERQRFRFQPVQEETGVEGRDETGITDLVESPTEKGSFRDVLEELGL